MRLRGKYSPVGVPEVLLIAECVALQYTTMPLSLPRLMHLHLRTLRISILQGTTSCPSKRSRDSVGSACCASSEASVCRAGSGCVSGFPPTTCPRCRSAGSQNLMCLIDCLDVPFGCSPRSDVPGRLSMCPFGCFPGSDVPTRLYRCM